MSPFWCSILAAFMFSLGFTYGVNYDTKVVPYWMSKPVKVDPPTDKVFDRGFIK